MIERDSFGLAGKYLARILLLFALLLPFTGACSAASSLPPLLYLGWDEAGRTQLYVSPVEGAPTALTATTADVLDYALSPEGDRIVYTTAHDDGTSEIWVMDRDGSNERRLLRCAQAECARPIWAPDGERIIYERSAMDDDGMRRSPYLYWLNVDSAETVRVLADEEARGSAATLSPDGAWLAYFAPEEEAQVLYNFQEGRRVTLPDELGSPVTWHPDGDKLLYSNFDLVVFHGDESDDHLAHSHTYATAVQIFVYDLLTGTAQRLSPESNIDDGAPTWSPDGTQIAFGRKHPRTSTGRQLWSMAADGSDAHAWTDEPNVHYGPPSWSPDGSHLLFQRFELDRPQSDPAIWLLDMDTGEFREIISAGMQPSWLAGTR